MSEKDSSSDTEDRNDIVKKVDLENEYNGVAIDVVSHEDFVWRRWRIPFPIVVIFILAVTAIVAIYYYFSEWIYDVLTTNIVCMKKKAPANNKLI